MRSGISSNKISVIIPVYNESEGIAGLLEYLQKVFKPGECEIILADGGSDDDTVEIASDYPCRIVVSPDKGRAAQMNYGARLAEGEIFYFLHADTYPPENVTSLIRSALSKSEVAAGCFQLRFDHDHPALKLYSWFTRFDVDLFRFGDQSLFIERQAFDKSGGFDEDLIVMEDQEIINRIRKEGGFRLMEEYVQTSARKYKKVGLYKLQLIFTLITILYYLGVPQAVLVHFYRTMIPG
ncbi:TIGR04283 family arsenosugar biosynthesis glycosyltransferase [Balneola sp. MJW-20]|uniref:TIGR04283 family arsenosugar biosynthesis glycosyltransferase n=1 Tax=Gracilimonas aurantiaca TaxID=3234185 RepID=UPI0034678B9D